jgi:hypothetical protein
MVGHKIHFNNPKTRIRDVPGIPELLAGEAKALLSAPAKHPHNTFGPKISHWDTTGTSVPPFDLHLCKTCGSGKSVRTFEYPRFD